MYKHQILCSTEGAFVSRWKKEDPELLTACPNDPAHAVVAGSASLVDISLEGCVQIQREVGFQTGKHARVDAVAVTAAAAGSATATKTWTVPIAIRSIRVAVPSAAVGCALTVEASPLTPVGALVAPAAAGSTAIVVTPTVLAAVALGFVVTLRQGADVEERGVVVAIDIPGATVTLERPAATPMAAGAAVLLTVRAAEQLPLATADMLEFGQGSQRDTLFPVGRALRVALDNPNPAPATVTLYVAYSY